MAKAMSESKIKCGYLQRAVEVSDLVIRKGDDGLTRLEFSASSEYPVARFFGNEVLRHDATAVRLERAKRGAMPMLFNHNQSDPIGMVNSATIKDRALQCSATLFMTDRAREVAKMIEGGMRNISVGYKLHEMEEDRDDPNTLVATDWEPYEVSIAPVPADPTIGVGRDAEQFEVRMITAGGAGNKPGVKTMSEESNGATAESGTRSITGGESNAVAAGGPGAAAARAGVELNAMQVEQSRIKAIQNLCRANNIEERLERTWVTSGQSVEAVSEDLLRVIEARGKANAKPASKLDLTPAEVQRFSIVKAIRACADTNWSDAGFEAECSRAIAAKVNKPADPKRFYVPYDVQQRGINRAAIARRDALMGSRNGMGAMSRAVDTVGSGAAGGYLVATELVSFIDLLRNRAVAFRLGARSLAGLVGNVTIPKLTGAATAYWLGSETSQINSGNSSNQTFSQLALTPHNVGGYTEISRQLLMQSTPDIEGIVNSDLAIITALAVDLGALQGTGTAGQPVGIIGTSGINSESAITSSGTYASLLDMQTQVANQNVIPQSGGYVAPFNVSAILAGRVKFANTYSPLWDGTIWDGDCAGFPGFGSKQMTNSTLLFGDWDQLIIAEWGVLELEVNPYANFQAGIIGIRSFMTVDIGLRYPGAFTYASSVA